MTAKRTRDHALRALQARLLMAARPEDVERVSRLLGGNATMAAHTLLDSDCDVDRCCARLEAAIARLMDMAVADAKRRTPVDTGALRRSTRTR